MVTITKEMTLGEVVQTYPETVHIMFKYGLHCIGCHVAAWETIEQGMQGHGKTPAEIEQLVKEMNEAVSESMSASKISPAKKAKK